MSTNIKSRLKQSRWIKHLAAATVITTFIAATACTITVDERPITIEWPNFGHCINQMADLMESNTPQEELQEAISTLVEDCVDQM